MDSISRRQLLQGAAAAAALSGAVSAVPAAAQRRRAAAGPPGGGDDWVHLRCAFKETMLDGHKVRLRAYNDQVPGPPIVTRPGATLRIRLENGLPPYSPAGWNGDHNVPHRFDLTNLHLHGLDVQPASVPAARHLRSARADDRGRVRRPSGLYVRNPRTTTRPASTGTTPIITARPSSRRSPAWPGRSSCAGRSTTSPRSAPRATSCSRSRTSASSPATIRPMPARTSGITSRSRTRSGRPSAASSPNTIPPRARRCRPIRRSTAASPPATIRCATILLNGEPFFKEAHNPAAPHQPTPTQLAVQRITMRPGEVVRFRMLNACSDNLMPILVEDHDMHLIALDGINFDARPHHPRLRPLTGPGRCCWRPPTAPNS